VLVLRVEKEAQGTGRDEGIAQRGLPVVFRRLHHLEHRIDLDRQGHYERCVAEFGTIGVPLIELAVLVQ